MHGYTFPVKEDHPAFSDNNAGAEARFYDDPPEAEPGDAALLVIALSDLVHIHTLAPTMILLRLMDPGISIREMAGRLRVSKTLVARIMQRVDTRSPKIKRILAGFSWKRSRGQRKRWTNKTSMET